MNQFKKNLLKPFKNLLQRSKQNKWTLLEDEVEVLQILSEKAMKPNIPTSYSMTTLTKEQQTLLEEAILAKEQQISLEEAILAIEQQILLEEAILHESLKLVGLW